MTKTIPIITPADRELLTARKIAFWPEPVSQERIDYLMAAKSTERQNELRRAANAAKRQNKEPAHPLGNAGSSSPGITSFGAAFDKHGK